MKESNKGTVLATLIAVPLVLICCGGMVLIPMVLAGAGGWLFGGGALISGVIAVAAGVGFLAYRSSRSSNKQKTRDKRNSDERKVSS